MVIINNAGSAGDVGELYGLLAGQLEQIVRLDVRAPEALIEDACQFAWGRLLRNHQRVHRETVLGWLARTAVHEAFKLLRRTQREVSLEGAWEEAAQVALRAELTPPMLIGHRERLAELDRLPERQQRALWLHALGLSYGEIAEHEACTIRTVERQLLRARRAIREGARDPDEARGPVEDCDPDEHRHPARRPSRK